MTAAPTCRRLAEALAATPGVPGPMIDRALRGYYDDYLSELAMPLTQLVADLRALASLPETSYASRLAIRALIDEVMNGRFDGTLEEAEAWARSPEGQDTLRLLTGGEAEWNSDRDVI